MTRFIWWLLLTVLSCSATSKPRGPPAGCDLSSPTSLSACVRNIIEASRPALKSKYDPIHIKSHSGGNKDLKWSVKDVYINGLSEFTIGKLDVRLKGTKIAVDMGVSWPKVVGKAKARVHKCMKIFFHRQCFDAHGDATVKLIQPSVRLSTALALSLAAGKPKLSPSKTDIKVSLPGIHIDPKFDGAVGRILGMVKQPLDRFANKFAKKFWAQNKAKIEKLMEARFNELVVDLSQKLPSLLTGLSKGNLDLPDIKLFGK
ncbi:hypothetical protein FJT64_013647 [Amphibalanus amphitrite]|uniref:Protein takeout n=1 Tax=Amphibalanus amphitrite TaxID=1232801 RepID=A0A6A4VEF2_AMPAM|nr:hypothetical protein FJT64_013647 [Amphibalanus amphitrite]